MGKSHHSVSSLEDATLAVMKQDELRYFRQFNLTPVLEAHLKAAALPQMPSLKITTIQTPEGISAYLAHRKVIVRWLIEVGVHLKFHDATVYETVLLVDRVFLVAKRVWDSLPKLPMFQLVAAACLLIVSKMEEMDEKVPTLAQLSHYCGNAYPQQQFPEMEIRILEALGWRIRCITPLHFLPYVLENSGKKIDSSEWWGDRAETQRLVTVLLGLALQHAEFLAYLPSEILAAVVLCADRIAVSHFEMVQIRLQQQLASSNVDDDAAPCSAVPMGDWSFPIVRRLGYKPVEVTSCGDRLMLRYREFLSQTPAVATPN